MEEEHINANNAIMCGLRGYKEEKKSIVFKGTGFSLLRVKAMGISINQHK